MKSSNLTPRDVASLAASFATEDLAKQAGIFRVDSTEGGTLIGRNGNADYSGLIFPYVWPGEDRIREYRLRRDKPEFEQKPSGEIKEKNKYLSPPGRGNLLYFMLGTDTEWLEDTTLPAVITEGEKKTIALYRLAFYEVEGDRPRFLPIGLSGAWNWRGTVGKTNDDNGARCDVKGVIPDFDRINWNGRVVYIVYDTNVHTNESVGAARRGLSRELKSRGADVRLIDLPQIDGVNGVDDLLAFKGPECVLSLFAEVDCTHSEKDALEIALQNPPKGSSRVKYSYFRDEVLPLLLKIEDEGERLAASDDAAKALGLKASDLRRILKVKAGSEDDEDSKELVLHEPELWSDPVDGAVLLDEIAGVVSRFLSASENTFKTVALWIIYAYAFDVFDTSPLLAIISPEKRCGKTTLLTLLNGLVPRPLAIANITASALFRTVEMYHPTLLIDEADSFLTDNEELRGILNSGHRKATAYVIRTTGEEHEPRRFTTWTPKAIALIGNLPGTLEDRSVIIRLERKRANDNTERLRYDGLCEFEHLRQRAARWIEDNREKLLLSDPEIPFEITNDRARDNWRPLLAIADAAGQDWPRIAREVATASSSVEPEAESTKVLLLNDLKTLFDEHGERLESEKIITYLIEIEGRPWAEISRGKPLSKIGLARFLKPFGIKPQQWRDGDKIQRGYLRDHFDEVFARYLDSHSVQSVHATESTAYEKSQSVQAHPSVPSGNDSKPSEITTVPSVPSRNTCSEEEIHCPPQMSDEEYARQYTSRGITNLNDWLAESKARADAQLGTAIWRNREGDQPVTILADLGTGTDGRRYVSIQGSDTGVPLDEIEYETSEEAAEREAILDYNSDSAPKDERILDEQGRKYNF